MKKIGLRELIITVLLTAIIVILNQIIGWVSVFFGLNIKAQLVVATTLQCLITAPIYYLVIKKVGRTGSVTIIGVIFSIFLFLSGFRSYVALLITVFFVVIAEIIMLKGGYQSKWRGFIVPSIHYSMNMVTVIVLHNWFPNTMKNIYIGTGMTEELANTTLSVFQAICTDLSFISLYFLACFGFSAIGFYIGHKLIYKHFSPSGKV